jgi:hypothetical protein
MSRSSWSGVFAILALCTLACSNGGSEYTGGSGGGGTTPPPATFAIRGAAKVGGAYTFAAIAGLNVRALSGSTQVATGVTDPAGRFSLSVPLLGAGQTYTVEASGNGYLTCTYPYVPTDGTSIDLPVLPMIPSAFSTGTGSIAGSIVNALDGTGVGSMTLKLWAGLHQPTTLAPLSTYTSYGDGSFVLPNVPAGYYTLQASKEGFLNVSYDVVCLGGRVSPNQDTATTPALLSGQMRIVLTWGQEPSDLDSHLTGPNATGGRFHVWYAGRDAGVANLDRDDTTSFGPETTTITAQYSGTYRFYVHDYSNGSATAQSPSYDLSRSSAKVQVFNSSGLLAVYNVPSNQGGTLWTVFEYDGTSIRAVNTIAYSTTASLPVAWPANPWVDADTEVALLGFGSVPKS